MKHVLYWLVGFIILSVIMSLAFAALGAGIYILFNIFDFLCKYFPWSLGLVLIPPICIKAYDTGKNILGEYLD